MKGAIFGALAASTVAGLLASGVAMAKTEHHAKKEKAGHGWCKSNECAGKVAGAKNECQGKAACKSITKEACEKDGLGTWTMAAKK